MSAGDTIPNGVPLTIDNSEPVEIVWARVPQSEFKLSDGTLIRARLSLKQFRRWKGHRDHHGAPVYSYETDVMWEVIPSKDGVDGSD